MKIISKRKKILMIIGITLIIISIISFFLLYTQSNKFKMKYDDDETFYLSNKNYFSYSNHSLSVFENDKNKTHIYKEKDAKTKNAICVEYKNHQIDINSDGLAIKEENDETYLIKGNTSNYVIFNNHIAYQTNEKTLVIYDLLNKNTNEIKTDSKITWFDANKDNIYIITRYNYTSASTTFNFDVYNCETLKNIQSANCNISEIANFLLCNNDIYVAYPQSSSIILYKFDFNTEKLKKLYQHYYVNNIVATDKYIIFNAEKYSTLDLITHTVEDESNGLWKYDTENDKATKISDECVFDDLIATNNYVYGYAKDYILPRGLMNSWTKGYKIKQITIDNRTEHARTGDG